MFMQVMRSATRIARLIESDRSSSVTTKVKVIKVSREWLGTTIPNAIELVVRGMESPEWEKWYTDTFGLTPQAGLKNIIQSLRNQANEGI